MKHTATGHPIEDSTVTLSGTRRNLIIDGAVATVLWIISVVVLFLFEPGSLNLRSLVVLGIISGLITLPLAFRRTHTVRAAAFIAAMFLAQAFIGFPLIPANVSLVVVVHALAYYAPRWASIGGLLLSYAGAFIAFLLYDSMLFVSNMNVLMRAMVWLLTGALITSAWLLGTVQRSRRALVRELTDRALRLEHEHAQERALAAAEERSRIAREMHDIVAHSLTVIITQADGASYAAKSEPEVATETLRTIAGTARSSLDEMRRLLGVLRQDEITAMGPTPELSSLPVLVEELRRAGLDVHLDMPGCDESKHRLPKGAELAMYRVVQEALTNVFKHAGPQVSVHVTLEWESAGLLVAVVDDGRGAGADPAPEGSGHGIRGMQERAALYGGNVVAQPKIGGGFAVHAWIPYHAR